MKRFEFRVYIAVTAETEEQGRAIINGVLSEQNAKAADADLTFETEEADEVPLP